MNSLSSMKGQLSANTLLSHYRIVSKLGAGGMGEVYLAIDTKLDRKVALKTLPAEFAANQDRMRRFIQEARAAAALNHPNIAHVYEIGESDGVHFIAMEYIEGVTLRDKIQRDREPLQKILKYLIQVAEGLAKAHLAGIVHRDLKPDNIMVTRDDYAKILDFGLAKLVEPHRAFGSSESDSSEVATAILRQQSIPGIVMGTVGYMSPEQASGRVNEIDHRSDIFSFGCVLFEAASGKKPFEGKDALESLYKVVHSPAPPLKEANPLAPDELQRVVRRCLAKEPDKRYQSMKEVAIEIDDLQHELKAQIVLEYRQPAATTDATASGATADEGFWVAVLPFKFRGSNVDLETLAEGLSEEIVTGLSRFSYLRVIGRGSTVRYANQTTDLRIIGKDLGARYVIEGSLRQAGTKLRLAVQLVDATTGADLWAENYERSFSPEAVFELQDDLVPQIVSTVADQYGALVHSMSESLRGRSAGQYTAHEAMLRLFGYLERMTPEEHSEVREILEAAVAAAPGHSGCHAALSTIYWNEYGHGYNVRPEPLVRALAAARQAVAVGPTNYLAHSNLATVLFFQKDFLAFRPAAERALALNTMDTSTTALLGTLIAYAGDWEYGLEVIERATKLNPHHPGWYHFPAFHNAYHRQDYHGALASALKFNMPGYFFTHAALAAVYGQLGEQERARAALRELHALIPNFGALARQEFGKWVDAEHTEHLLDGLRKAGLAVVEAEQTATPEGETSSSGTFARSHATEDQSANQPAPSPAQAIAVLPFANISADEDNEYFCDGLAEELLNALSKIEALRVAARTSAFSFKGKDTDVREIGQKLNVSTVLEGSVRKVGNRLRITAQLVNIADGYHLWSERYDREMKDIFDVQDEITLTVVDALKMKLLGEEKAAVLKHYTDDTEAYQFYLKGRYHANRFTREGFQKAVEYLNEAINKDPDYALAYAGIADAYYHAATIHMPPGEAFPKLKAACAKALELDNALADAHTLFAVLVDHYDRKPLAAESGFRRGIELAPNSVFTHEQYGLYLAKMGRFAEAVAELRRAQELDPLSLISSFLLGWTYYFARQPEKAKEEALKALEIDDAFWMGHWTMALGYEQRSQYSEALAELEKAKALDDSSWIPAIFARVYARVGREDDAQKILDELTEKSKQQWVAPYMMATAYVSLGKRDQAFERLQKALEDYDEWIGCISVDPALDPIRSDPRFQDLARRIGLPL